LPFCSYHFFQVAGPWAYRFEFAPQDAPGLVPSGFPPALPFAEDCGSYLKFWGMPAGQFCVVLIRNSNSPLLMGCETQAWPAARSITEAAETNIANFFIMSTTSK